ncbi:hypothetical protein Tco_0221518 [Tanacetum coccineum]
MEDKIECLGNDRVIIQRDFDQLETELQEARTQISKFQREQIRHDDEIVLARVRISTLEMIIEDIQDYYGSFTTRFSQPLYPDMINDQNIEHMILPTPPRDTEPHVGSPISLSPSSSVGSSSPVRMAPKRTSTSAPPAMTQAAIRKLGAIIEDIQVRHRSDMKSLLDMIRIMDMINNQDIEHMTPPTPPRDTEPPVGSPIPLSLSSSVGSSSPVRSTTPPPDYPFDESIFAELDNSLWIISRTLKSEPVLEKPNEMALKRTSTSAAPPMTQAAIKKLVVVDSSCRALEESTEGVVGLIRWFERNMDSVFLCSNCSEDLQSEIATGTSNRRSFIPGGIHSPAYWNIEEVEFLSNYVPILRNLWKSSSGDYPGSIEGNVYPSKSPQTWEIAIPYPEVNGSVSDLQQGGLSDQELQKQRTSHWKQPTTNIRNLSCLWGERALQKLVPKSKQQCPRKSILAEGQERSPRPERSHKYVPSKPTSS